MKRILYVTNRYRLYDSRMYEVLADAFDLRVLWASPPPASEPVPADWRGRFRWWVLDESDDVIRAAHVRRSAELLQAIVREGRDCDLIVASTSDSWKARVAFAAAELCGVPLALRKEKWRDHPNGLSGRRRITGAIQQRVTDFLERSAAGMLVGGSQAADYLARRGVPRERIAPFRYLHPDLGARPVNPAEVARLRSLAAGRTSFLYLGRVMPRKGLLPLLRAFGGLGDRAVLFVAGEAITADTGRGAVSSGYFAECRRLAEADPRVILLGPVPADQVQNVYAAADVFVHPHVADVDGKDVHEGWGNVITEAACMSMPIVTTDRVASAFDVVMPGINGHRLDAERIDVELPGALASYVGDRARVEAYGRASRRRYEEFVDPMLNVESLNHVIEQARGSS